MGISSSSDGPDSYSPETAVEIYLRGRIRSILPLHDTTSLIQFMTSCVDIPSMEGADPEYVYQGIMNRIQVPTFPILLSLMKLVVSNFTPNEFENRMNPDAADG